MEKFSQFRDRGSGISPFIPVATPVSAAGLLLHGFIFAFRLLFFVPYIATYFLFLRYLPLPTAFRKLLLWGIMGIPGIWWVDLQLDGVKRGHLAEQPRDRVPHPGSVIAANFTSPIDALYLAAIFDPIFTVSYPNSRKVKRVGLWSAMLMALSPRQLGPYPEEQGGRAARGLTDLRALLQRYPDRIVAVFPESGTTNGKGVLPLSPSLLAVPRGTRIFPVSMRYTPADITTPLPGAYLGFLWKLLSRPTHLIRVRMAEGILNTSTAENGVGREIGPTDEEVEDGDDDDEEEEEDDEDDEDGRGRNGLTPEEKRVLDKVGEALARLGRSGRVGLTLRDKAAFVGAWNKRRK